MTTTTKHTALPWRIVEFGKVVTPDGDNLLVDGVSLPCGNNYRQAEAEANTELIVHAVNSHHDLLAACRAAEQAIDSIRIRCSESEWVEDWNGLPDVLNQLQAVIAAAGKG